MKVKSFMALGFLEMENMLERAEEIDARTKMLNEEMLEAVAKGEISKAENILTEHAKLTLELTKMLERAKFLREVTERLKEYEEE